VFAGWLSKLSKSVEMPVFMRLLAFLRQKMIIHI